jgi:hypothetical protein
MGKFKSKQASKRRAAASWIFGRTHLRSRSNMIGFRMICLALLLAGALGDGLKELQSKVDIWEAAGTIKNLAFADNNPDEKETADKHLPHLDVLSGGSSVTLVSGLLNRLQCRRDRCFVYSLFSILSVVPIQDGYHPEARVGRSGAYD